MPKNTIPGGVYEDGPEAGTYHDANGNPVTKDGKPVEKGSEKGAKDTKKK